MSGGSAAFSQRMAGRGHGDDGGNIPVNNYADETVHTELEKQLQIQDRIR